MRTTVVITNYNYGRFFEEAYLSILKQTRRPDEIIVVDDISTDDSISIIRAIIARYADTPLAIPTQLSISEVKGYVGGSKNRGIEKSTGEVVAFLDGDDYYLPSKLEKSLAILNRYAEVGLVYTDYYMMDDATKQSRYEYKYSFDLNTFRQICCISTNQVVRRAVFEQIGPYKENWKGPEDYEIWNRMIRAGWMAYHLPEALFSYRLHGKNVTLTTTQEIVTAEQGMKQSW